MDDDRIVRAIVGTLREHDLSGHEIWGWLGPVHGSSGELSEATLYPTLYRLEAERIIESYWREGERTEETRRVYRIATKGQVTAAKRGWGPIAPHRTDSHGGLAADEDPPAVAPTGSGAPAAVEAPAVAVPKAEVALEPGPETAPPEIAAPIARYLARLDASLKLGSYFRSDVRIEIRDHLVDCSAALEASGLSPDAAVEEAIERIGPAEDLGRATNEAQLTTERLRHGIRWGSADAGVALVAGFGITACGTLIVTPILASILTLLAHGIGVHLYIPDTGEWHTEQVSVAAWVGAFLAGRRSISQVTRKSRRDERTVWRIWSVLGAVPLLLFAVLMPLNMDPIAAAALLGIPVAYVLGTRRPQRPYDETVTTRGALGALAILVLALLLPGGRLWVYQPGERPSAAPPPATLSAPVTFSWLGPRNSPSWQVDIFGLDETTWTDARVELWPSVRSGVAIVPDQAAREPSLIVAPGDFVDFSTITRRVPEWWVAVTAIGPDGQRHTLASEVRFGYPTHFQGNIINWLRARR